MKVIHIITWHPWHHLAHLMEHVLYELHSDANAALPHKAPACTKKISEGKKYSLEMCGVVKSLMQIYQYVHIIQRMRKQPGLPHRNASQSLPWWCGRIPTPTKGTNKSHGTIHSTSNNRTSLGPAPAPVEPSIQHEKQKSDREIQDQLLMLHRQMETTFMWEPKKVQQSQFQERMFLFFFKQQQLQPIVGLRNGQITIWLKLQRMREVC